MVKQHGFKMDEHSLYRLGVIDAELNEYNLDFSSSSMKLNFAWVQEGFLWSVGP